ncbi:MAG: hypothetical protein E7Z81_03185 [Methanobrevibacter sp.]|uniref:hypothetical protein n=1 Tax=Methanobrevibacter sp. TaxID=66852 RepID=UPI0025E3ADCA|nr:hypothetical protein [Methanobrevibacter sp.]MBE6497271.1 hypothetical protein [Methanobrevibacter sp.]
MKKIIFTAFIILLILSVGAVSAENSTDTTPTEINDTEMVEIKKPDLKFDVDFPEELNKHYDGDGPYAEIINATDDGEYHVYFDGIHNPKYDFYGYNYFEVGASSFSLGKHNVTFAFMGDEFYNPTNVTKYFSVVDVGITVPKGDVSTDSAYALAEVPIDATGYVTIKLDGKQIKKIDVTKCDHEGSLRYISQSLDTALGKHVVEVTYSGDKKYSKVSKKSEFNIFYDMWLENEYVTYGRDEMIGIQVPSGITKNLIVEIDGENHSTTYNARQEIFYVNITGVGLGAHEVSITYNGDSKYPKNTVKQTLNVRALIDIPLDVSYGDGGKISLKLPKDANGNLTIYISTDGWIRQANESLLYGNVKLVDGYGEIDVSHLKVGDYYYMAEYSGEDYQLSEAMAQGSISIAPRVVLPRQMNYGDDEYLQVFTNPDFNEKIIIFFVEAESESLMAKIEITPVNGTANHTLKNLPIKLMQIHTHYGEYDNDNGPMIHVKGVEPKLTSAKDITMFYNDGSKFSVKVYGEDGKLVKAGKYIYFKIGSKTYKEKTDSKGIATHIIKETPGKYTITAIYKNYQKIETVNDGYNDAFAISYKDIKVSKKLTVKQVLTLKAVKVKKSAKKLVLTATLKNKKVIKNKQVTFKFNGKTYKAKTNSKGIAKVTIKSNILKKLKVGKKITYQATYLKDTVKKTVKVLR